MSRAVVQRVFPGDLECASEYPLELVQRAEKPDMAAPRRVLVRMKLRPVHPIDLRMVRTGELARFGDDGRSAVGSEGVGVVEAIGEGVEAFSVGQRVVPVLFWKYLRSHGCGAWQDYVEVAEEDVLVVADSVPDEVACQYVINPWTAHGLLVDIAVPKGEFLLLSAAASTIGRQIVQMAKHYGIRIVAIVRHEEQKEELKALGAEFVVNSEVEDIVAVVMKITGGQGVYAALDGVGGSLTKSIGQSIRNGGDLFIFAALGGPDFTMTIADLIRKVRVRWWYLTEYLENEVNKQRTIKEVMGFFEKKILFPSHGRKYNISDFKEAIKESGRSADGGKILLVS